MKQIARLIAAILLCCGATTAAADFPERPIRLVVPFSPGGGADISSRIISQYLAEALGKPVIVDNRPGAAGNIGTELVARAAPDGYTLLLASISTAVNASLFTSLPFNTVTDFQPVSLFITVPLMMVVNPSVPANSVADMIALAKAKPGQLNYASGGVGTANHIAAELFKYTAKVDVTHVPYKGGGPALNDLMGGQVQLYFGTITSVREQAKAGRVRALATTGATRSSAAPELPTVAETVPGFEVVAWYAVLAPTGTPKPIVERLSAELVKIVHNPAVQEQIRAQGAEAVGSTPAEATRFIHAEVDKWSKVVKASGMRPE